MKHLNKAMHRINLRIMPLLAVVLFGEGCARKNPSSPWWASIYYHRF